MAKFSICGGDDGEGPSNNHGSRKRQRLPSIDENEEDAEVSDSGEEESDDGGSTSVDSDREVVMEDTRSVNSESSSSKDLPLSVTLLDSDVLDCPICCEPLKIPIFQCDNGHLACSVCCFKVRNRCPSCTLPIGYIRCRAMEKVIEASRVSCPNARYGCKETMLYGNRFGHEKLCVFSPCVCPVLNCNYTACQKDLNKHVRAKHRDDLIPFIWNVGVSLTLDLNDKTTILQEQNDGQVILVQVFKALHAVYVSVSCLAPLVPEVGNFSCCLINLTPNSLLKQGFMVKSIQKVRNEVPEDGFMLIPSYMLSGNDNFNMQISIARGRGLCQ